MDFSKIAEQYAAQASIQQSAATMLMKLLEIKETEVVLDLGCGPGHITNELQKLSQAPVIGIDPSEGMIKQARETYRGDVFHFAIGWAETLAYSEKADVIFSNSAMQWFGHPEQALRNCYRTLKAGGRIGVQAPATLNYCPNFIRAIEAIRRDDVLDDTLNHYNYPWWMLENAEDYGKVFSAAGFNVEFSQIQTLKSRHSPEEVYTIFSSGAIVGYLNPENYNRSWPEHYEQRFKEHIRQAFIRQAGEEGNVELIFNRVFLIATKPELER